MNTLKLKFTLICLFVCSVCMAENSIKKQLADCKTLTVNSARLACYDGIAPDYEVHNNQPADDEPTEVLKNEFPALIADLNEPNLFVSLGTLDFLGGSGKAVLIGGGKRQSVKDFAFSNGKSIALNAFGQIRSQFDVDEIDTRNNRGGALINTDFSVGGEIVQSLDHWNWRFSYTHRSTHLGDEFLIDNQEFLEQRINLSYEVVRWDAHKAINNWDLYAGLGFITRSEPGSLDKFMWQAGWQFQGDFWHQIKPIWAVDLTSWGAYDWNINVNMRAGIEIHNFTNSPFQLLFEYQDGHSPYGQFFTEDLTFTGLTFLKNW